MANGDLREEGNVGKQKKESQQEKLTQQEKTVQLDQPIDLDQAAALDQAAGQDQPVDPEGPTEGPGPEPIFQLETNRPALVACHHLVKRFGKNTVLDDVSLQLARGRVLGLLGGNGSGKSTFMSVLAALVHPTEGTASVDGVPVGQATKALVSYFPEGGLVGPNETVKSARSYYKSFFPDFDEDGFNALVERLKIPNKRVGHLSTGFRVRLSMALCLSRRAALYLLDEPLGNLDPLARDEILDLLRETIQNPAEGQTHVTMILATQHISEMAPLFDEAAIFKDGRLLALGPVEELVKSTGGSLEALYKKRVG